MKDEIKEILEQLKIRNDLYNDRDESCIVPIEYYEAHILLDYITNLQEQLHQASLDIQELTEKDIGCPSWCDKLTNLQEENERLHTRIKTIKRRRKTQTAKIRKYREEITNKQNSIVDYKSRNKKAIEYIGNGNIGIPRKTRDKFIDILKGENKDD